MNYPIVYDKFETDFDNFGLAVLKNATNVKLKEVINGEFSLSLVLPRTDPRWAAIKEENFIKVDGQLFRIRGFDEIRDSSGKLLSNIQGEHVWYDANNCRHIPLFEMIGASPRAILEAAFAGTRYTVGTVDAELANTDIELEKTNPAATTNKLVQNVGGELERNNYIIGLRTKVGNNNGVQFRVNKNNVDIKKSTSSKNLCTRLYPYGADDLDITSVNGGLAYIDSPLINDYDYIHESYEDFKDIDDPTELMAAGLAKFSTEDEDGIDKPEVTYELTAIELKKLTGRSFESFSRGDTVRIIDEDLGIDVNARILEYERYPYEAERSRVVLGNFKSKLSNLLVSLADARNKLSSMTTASGKVKVGWMENIIESLQTEIEAGLTKKAVVHDHGDIWVDDIDNPTKAMTIVNGMFAIADNKKENGDWDWRTFGTGSGFVADLIVSGIVRLSEALTVENDDGTVQLLSTGMKVTETDVAQAVIQAGQIAMQVWENGAWKSELYFDTQLGQFVFDGKLTADVIEASASVITKYLQAEGGTIARLTVDQLDTSYKKIANFLNSNTEDIMFRRIYEEEYEVIVATTDGALSEQLAFDDGSLLYWVDETHDKYTFTDTGLPVMVYVYDEVIKKREYFDQEAGTGYYYPIEMDGAGVGDGDKGRTYRYKDSDGFHIEYHHSLTDELIDIILNDDGVQIDQLIAMGLTQLDFTAGGFTAHFGDNDSTSYTWTKDGEGRITKLTEVDTSQEIIINWPA